MADGICGYTPSEDLSLGFVTLYGSNLTAKQQGLAYNRKTQLSTCSCSTIQAVKTIVLLGLCGVAGLSAPLLLAYG